MHTTCVIQEPRKKQKVNEEEDIDWNHKCLGDLLKAVLRHILSFLPTKDAVRTSVLSKRWEYLWASTPNLDFERSLLAKRNFLRNFVERVFCLRDCCVMEHSLSIVMCSVMHLVFIRGSMPLKEPRKKQKLNEEEDIDWNHKCLGDLLEAVRHKCLGDLLEAVRRHILSFLPTKDAVRTSVLPKRTLTNEVLRALSLVPTSRPTPWLSLHPYFLYQILATWLKFGQSGR
ncbi:uncharacterized protein LOC133852638 [Alnus glutinosa]|uniref:uncharacterized protein LOC133852638 n=1 Tax=Alnus glutinosa TaxID=3517 RepID=UPI002D797086|nr:uncharacterized protein LOC133852638 [Alnus glutinosa]